MPHSPSHAPTTRRASLDLLKILSCLSIVLLHAVAGRVEQVDGSAAWHVANFLSAATREAVPVFFMISGILLLRKDVGPYRPYFSRLFLRYAIPLLGGLAAYKGLAISQGDATPLLDTVFYNFAGNLGFHLWFLWTFLGLALVAPLLRPMVAEARTRGLFLVLWCVYCVVGPWLLEAGIRIPVANTLFMLHTGYFVLGYDLDASPRRLDERLLAAGILLSVAGIAALTAVASLGTGQLDARLYEGSSPLLVVFGACTLKLFLQRFPGTSTPLVRTLAGATFTIYIYHVIALSLASRLLGPSTLAMRVFVHTPIAFAACTLLFLAGRRIPLVRAFFPG